MNRLIIGDCRDLLRALIADRVRVNTVVTSPPYWGLRDYGHAGAIGLEPSIDEWVDTMVDVFSKVRDVLTDDGTVWMNLGDAYCHGTGADRAPTTTAGPKVPASWSNRSQPQRIRSSEKLKAKDLCGLPWRVALALQDDGWYLRQDIIWSKPNPMPESVYDRCTKAHEYLFLLSKSERYYYDSDAIREPASENSHPRRGYKTPDGWDTTKGQGGHGSFHRDGREEGQPGYEHKRPGVNPKAGPPDGRVKQNDSFSAAVVDLVGSRNRRSVWEIPTAPFPGAHFATFPPALVEPCILAGTSAHGHCVKCGAGWERIVELGAPHEAQKRYAGADARGDYHGTAQKDYDAARAQDPSATKARILAGMRERITTGWRPTCKCGAGAVPGLVLDPFFGSGTTGEVAQRLGRHWLGIEINPAYEPLHRDRCAQLGMPL